MLAIYCHDARVRKRLEAAARGSDVRAVGDWRRLEALAADGATCSVVVIPRLDRDPETERLPAFRARFPLHSVVLVTRGDLGNARGLAGLPVDEVVWLDEVERELAPAVARTCVLAGSRTFAAVLRVVPIPAGLRQALVRAAGAGHPVRTVASLARAAGCDRRTLWNQWKQTAAGDLRLQDFLQWLLLVRATASRTSTHSWAAVAGELGVHPHTLGRLARRLVGMSLTELAESGQGAVAERFGEEVVSRLARAN